MMHVGLPKRTVLLVGVPDAGKSNFLFRLWIALNEGTGLLVRDGMPSDVEYLRNGSERLLAGQFADRTSKEVHERPEIPVTSVSNGLGFRGALIVPDVSGEQILSIYHARQWSREWEDLVSDASGCLVFIRPESPELVAPLDWTACFKLCGGAPAAGTPYEDLKTPTQVVLVDWLQFLRKAMTDRVGGTHRPHVGIVVSAWDAVPMEQQPLGAERWMAENLPLLHQFTQTNDHSFDFAFFGVTVTAGDLKNDAEYQALYVQGDPRKAGYVMHALDGSVTQSSDMTLPVAWALGLVGAVAPLEASRP